MKCVGQAQGEELLEVGELGGGGRHRSEQPPLLSRQGLTLLLALLAPPPTLPATPNTRFVRFWKLCNALTN